MHDENFKADLKMTASIDLYYDVFIPESSLPKLPLLLAVHGYGAHKRYMMREARIIAPKGFVIASVQAPHQHFRKTDDGYRVGFGWLTDHRPEEYVRLHHKFLLDVIESLSGQNLINRKQIFLFGFSQACALNFRFALTYPDVLRGIIGVCGGIPGDLDTNPDYQRYSAPAFYLYGDQDEFYPQEKFVEFDVKLRERLPNYVSKHYQAKHEITNEMRDDMRVWLAEQGNLDLTGPISAS